MEKKQNLESLKTVTCLQEIPSCSYLLAGRSCAAQRPRGGAAHGPGARRCRRTTSARPRARLAARPGPPWQGRAGGRGFGTEAAAGAAGKGGELRVGGVAPISAARGPCPLSSRLAGAAAARVRRSRRHARRLRACADPGEAAAADRLPGGLG